MKLSTSLFSIATAITFITTPFCSAHLGMESILPSQEAWEVAVPDRKGMSVELDTAFPTPSTLKPPAIKMPEEFARPTPSLTRRFLNYMNFTRMIRAIDNTYAFMRFITWSTEKRMPTAYFDAYEDMKVMLQEATAQRLFHVYSTDDVYVFAVAKLGQNAATNLISSFINHVSLYLQATQGHIQQLQKIRDSKHYAKTLSPEMRTAVLELLATCEQFATHLEAIVRKTIVGNQVFAQEQKNMRQETLARHGGGVAPGLEFVVRPSHQASIN